MLSCARSALWSVRAASGDRRDCALAQRRAFLAGLIPSDRIEPIVLADYALFLLNRCKYHSVPLARAPKRMATVAGNAWVDRLRMPCD